MTSPNQYEIVRIVRILHPLEEYDSWHVNKRAPQVGDTGTIVDILQASNLPTKYVVEAVEPDGTTLWLSDFDVEEITAA